MLEKDTGKLVLLSSEAPVSQGGTQLAPIQYADDLAFASDGAIYFTDASEIPPGYNSKGFYDTMASYILDVFQVSLLFTHCPVGSFQFFCSSFRNLKPLLDLYLSKSTCVLLLPLTMIWALGDDWLLRSIFCRGKRLDVC